MVAACAIAALHADAGVWAFWTATLLLAGLFAVPALWGRRAPALSDLAVWPLAALLYAVAAHAPRGAVHAV